MSDTPFTDRFNKPFAPGVWWHVCYSAKGNGEHGIYSEEFKFDHHPDTFPLDRIDHCQKKFQDQHPGKHILMLSWSMFTVPESTKDV